MSPDTILASRLQEDITWRIRELSELVRACKESTGDRKSVLLRASVPVIYAHWEGNFVAATNSYLSFLTDIRLSTKTLRDELWALTVRRKFKPSHLHGDTQFTSFLLEIRSGSDTIFKRGSFEKINGKSNLRSDVLKSCCACIGLNANIYANYFDFLDTQLVETRNYVAHGSSLRFDEDVVMSYREKVVDLMRITQNEIENSVAMGHYKKQS